MLLPGQTMERRVESAEEHWIGPCLQLGPAGVVVGAGYVFVHDRRHESVRSLGRCEKTVRPIQGREDGAIMTKHEPSVSVSQDIDPPLRELFKYLARPADHTTIDGSGMLRGTDDRQRLSGIGDVFEMKMFNDEMGEYVMENHVVEFEPDRRIAWEPVLKAIDKPDFQSGVGERAITVGAGI